MKFFGLLLMGFSLVGLNTRGIKASSGTESRKFLQSLYADDSHESFHPSDFSHPDDDDTVSTTLRDQEEFLSSLSSDNVEYVESSESARVEPLRASEKLSISESSDAARSPEDSTNDISANKCNFSDISSRIQSYVKLGDKIIRKQINNARDHESSVKTKEVESQDSLGIDVTHDVFETTSSQAGLFRGIIYKGKVRCAFRSLFSSASDAKTEMIP